MSASAWKNMENEKDYMTDTTYQFALNELQRYCRQPTGEGAGSALV